MTEITWIWNHLDLKSLGLEIVWFGSEIDLIWNSSALLSIGLDSQLWTIFGLVVIQCILNLTRCAILLWINYRHKEVMHDLRKFLIDISFLQRKSRFSMPNWMRNVCSCNYFGMKDCQIMSCKRFPPQKTGFISILFIIWVITLHAM